MKPQFGDIEVAKLLENVLALCRVRIQSKQLKIDTVIDAIISTVSIDVELMEQALQGLMVNAIEASPAQGRLDVTCLKYDGKRYYWYQR